MNKKILRFKDAKKMVGVIYNDLDPNKAYCKTVKYPAFMTHLCHKAYNRMINTFEGSLPKKCVHIGWYIKSRIFYNSILVSASAPKMK